MTACTSWRAALIALGVILPCIAVTAVHGQNLLPPQVLDPSVRTAIPPAQPRAGDILGPPAPGPCPLASSNLQFTLTGVEFTGVMGVNDVLQAAYGDLVGRQIPVSAICEIRDRATTILFQRGLLARVEIPQQTVMGGRVTFTVIEAFIAAVVVRGNAGPAQDKVDDYIENLRGLRPFDINKAQRYLLLASDIPGVVISATLRPSAEAPGAVELDVDVAHVVADAVLNSNNFNARSAGRITGLVRGDLNSITGLGERTSIIGYNTLEGPFNAQRVIQAVEEARIGSGGLLFRVSGAYGTTRPGDILRPLDINGHSIVVDGRLAYPIIRERSLNITASGGLNYIRQDVDTAGLPLIRDSLSILFGRIGFDQAFAFAPVILGGGLEVRQGIPGMFDTVHAGASHLSRVAGDPGATEFRGDARIAINWLPYVSTIGIIQGQYSWQPLLTYEEFTLGNLTIGRGYDPSVLSGHTGVGGSAEIHFGPLPNFQSVPLLGTGSIYGFFDDA
ncbi:MAG: ShlB/FhaC/HecB family hemolysin secretion/activation protein, partial [Alphaproteobacteria bacterium]|nr:ShlB/FhaC/HecB family hemolysin secretion/activation protein [Alphaproteobacteria bacterium]